MKIKEFSKLSKLQAKYTCITWGHSCEFFN